MRKRMSVGLRTWVLGAAATGLLAQSCPSFGQTKNSAPANAKKGASTPATARSAELPQLLAVPTELADPSSTILPASQVEVAQNEKSEVQKQLEMLYEKDGREMPEIKINMQPLNPAKTLPQTSPATRAGQPAGSTTQKPAPAATGYTKFQQPPSRTPASSYPSQPNPQAPKNYSAALAAQSLPQTQTQPKPLPQAKPSQNRITGFFKRFVPTGRKSSISTAPIPPDYANSVPDVPAASSLAASIPYKAPPVPTTPTVQLTTKPILSPVPLQASPLPLIPQAPVSVGFNTMELPQPTFGLPQLAQTPLPLTSPEVDPLAMPPLLTEPDPRALLANSASDETKISIPSKDTMLDFPNPFPETTENQADLTNKSKPEMSKGPDQTSASAGDVQVAEDDSASGKLNPDEDPYAVRVKDFSEPKLDENVDASVASAPKKAKPGLDAMPADESLDDSLPPAPPMPELAGPTLDVGALKPAEQPLTEMEAEYVEKMRKIRDRFGMKGLKGFCPVTLRDERELFDAKPEFFYTHRGQKFHFATAEARNKFEADPAAYAPAAYGADVVALGRDKDVVEGTLDFAAWFKGRLYLFGSQANYEVFVKSPATYASPAGIE